VKKLIYPVTLLLLVTSCAPIQPSPTSTPFLPTHLPTSTPIPTSTPTHIPPTATPTSIPPTAPPTPTLGPLPGLVPEGIVITYTGKECTSSGPTELPPGEYTFVLRYKTNEGHMVYVGNLIEGKTFDEVVEKQAKPGRYLPPFWSWIEEADLSSVAKNESRNEKYFTYALEEGENVVFLYSYSTPGLWLCAPIWVK